MEEKPINNKSLAILLGVLLLIAIGVGLIFRGDNNLGSLVAQNQQGISLSELDSLAQFEQTGENVQMQTTSELEKEDLVVGTGDEAQAGKSVTVHYVGTLLNGTKFDSSRDRGEPFTFNLGAGEVIEGWDLGVSGMKVGGKRVLTIPSELAYGPAGAPPVIGPNETLVFEVELLEVN